MSKLNKIVTNYPVTLTPEEVANLSETLSAVRTAGGGEGGQIYIAGDSNINVDNEHYRISLTEKATELLEREIPSAVSQLSDSASYAKVEDLANYQPVGDYLSANALDNLSGTWNTVTQKLDTTAFSTVSGNFLTAVPAGYATETYVQTASAGITGWVNEQGYLKEVPDTYYLKTETSGKDEISDAFSNIPAYILTGDSNITATSAQEGKDIKWNLSINAHPTVTDTTLTGERGIYTHTTDVSGQWCVEMVQSAYEAINDVSNKLDNSDFTTYTGTTAPNTYLTKTSADTLYQPTGDYVTTADILTGTSNTLTGIKIGSTDYTIPTTDLSDYYTKTQVDSTFASASQLNSYLTTAQYQTDSATYVTSGNEISAANEQYALTTTGWAKIETPATFTGVTTTGSVSGGGVNNDTIGLLTSAENALTAVANKVDKPDTTQTSLNNKYLVYSTLSGTGEVTGWTDFNANVYSKTESDGRYQKKTDMSSYLTTAQYETDSATFVTSSNSTITGTKQYALTTAGWAEVSTPTIPDITANNGLSANGHTIGIDNTNLVANTQYAWTTTGWTSVETAYLPTSGGTVSGQLVVSGDGSFDQQFLKIIRENVNGYGRIGLGQSGPLALKVDDANQHTTQVNISPNTTNDQLVQVQHNGGTIGYLIPAVTSTTTAGLTNDGILHIILESE